MADANAGVEIPSDTNNASDDVFVNGNSDNGRNSALLHPDICTLPEQVIPRRSSLVKDMNRRGQGTHKKTVSFSSMPNEKIVVNGRYRFIFLAPSSATRIELISYYLLLQGRKKRRGAEWDVKGVGEGAGWGWEGRAR